MRGGEGTNAGGARSLLRSELERWLDGRDDERGFWMMEFAAMVAISRPEVFDEAE